MSKVKTGFLMAALVGMCVTFSGCMGCAMVESGDVGIKKSMGVVSPKLLAPGFSLYNPFLDDIDVVSVKQIIKDAEAAPLTSDQQPITIHFKIQYRIPQDQVVNLYTTVKGDPYDTLVAPQIQEAWRQVVSQYKADAVISGVNVIKDKVLAMARENLHGQVIIADVPVTHIELPQALQQSIIQKQQMEVDAKKKAYELDKENKQAEITVTKARAEAESIKLQSQALANSPKLVDLKWVEKWDGHLPETVAGSNSALLMGVKGR